MGATGKPLLGEREQDPPPCLPSLLGPSHNSLAQGPRGPVSWAKGVLLGRTSKPGCLWDGGGGRGHSFTPRLEGRLPGEGPLFCFVDRALPSHPRQLLVPGVIHFQDDLSGDRLHAQPCTQTPRPAPALSGEPRTALRPQPLLSLAFLSLPSLSVSLTRHVGAWGAPPEPPQTPRSGPWWG